MEPTATTIVRYVSQQMSARKNIAVFPERACVKELKTALAEVTFNVPARPHSPQFTTTFSARNLSEIKKGNFMGLDTQKAVMATPTR